MRPSYEVAVAVAGVILSAIAAGGWYASRRRQSPGDREKRRRALVSREGRMIDAEVTDINEETVFYSYSVRGVDYLASQEITELRHLMKEDLGSLVGPATAKFMNQNPVNSIVVCEDWNGFSRGKKKFTLKKERKHD